MYQLIKSQVIFLLLLFFVAEMVAAYFFPEFRGHVHSAEKTLSIITKKEVLLDHSIRGPGVERNLDDGKPLILVIGDSISAGYGTAYEDIWWKKLERLLAVKGVDVNIISFAQYGKNEKDSEGGVIKFINSIHTPLAIDIKKVIYQFNYNDLMPQTRSDIQSPKTNGFLPSVQKFRYEYLNRSVFLRVAQHYVGRLTRRTSGNCSERGLDALGPYSYSFGLNTVAQEAELAWENFEERWSSLRKVLAKRGIEFEIFISPLVFDIDKKGRHRYFNYLNYDFSCATIDPKSRLRNFSGRHGIKLHDPVLELERSFEARIAEGNFEPYFFAADENHFNPTAATYIAEALAKNWEG